MQFYEINVCEVMIFKHYTVYNKHVMIKIGNHTEDNRKYYHKDFNKFDEVCSWDYCWKLLQIHFMFNFKTNVL